MLAQHVASETIIFYMERKHIEGYFEQNINKSVLKINKNEVSIPTI